MKGFLWQKTASEVKPTLFIILATLADVETIM